MHSLPTYMIIGAMKSGTTALNDFICAHPAATAAKTKEIHFFSLNLHKGLDWYKEHFPNEGDLICGDASPTYFDIAYTQTIPLLIQRVVPDCRLFLIVRDPIDRAVSHYHHLKRVNRVPCLANTEINDFLFKPYDEMLRQTTAEQFYLHQIIDFSLYARKYMTYTQLFSPDQLLVLGTWELRNEPQNTMDRVYAHLGVPAYQHDSFAEIRYSSGQTADDLEEQVRQHLFDLFEPDFQQLCRLAGLQRP